MACRSIQKGARAAEDVRDTKPAGTVSHLELDVTSQTSINDAVEIVAKQFGRIDVLINNAGMFMYDRDADLEKNLTISFRTNTLGPALMAEAFQQLLLKSRKPYILNVASTLGCIAPLSERWPDLPFVPDLDCVGYRTSKAALNMLTVYQNQKLGPKGIKVFAVGPGLMDTNLRGKEYYCRTAGGNAVDPMVAGEWFLSIANGERDEDVGKCIKKDGLWPW